MKVILMQELKGKGGEGDVVDVAQGFAVNYLLPQGIAIEATKGNLKQLEQRMHNIQKRESKRIEDANAIKAALDGKAVVIGAKVGEDGQLFGSITAPMIAEAIKAQYDIDFDRKKVDLRKPIKLAGDHIASLAIYRDIKADLTVTVKSDAAIAAEAAEAEAAAAAAAEAEAEAAEAVEAEAEEVAEETAAE